MANHRATDSPAKRREQSKLPSVSYVAFILAVGGFKIEMSRYQLV